MKYCLTRASLYLVFTNVKNKKVTKRPHIHCNIGKSRAESDFKKERNHFNL